MSRLSNRRLKEIRGLTRKKVRERRGETIVEGLRSVAAAVNAEADVREVLMTPEARADERTAALLARVEERIHVVADLDDLSDVETSQGVLAVVGIRRMDAGALAGCRRLLVLDGLQDPGNAGTLIRTAAWFGLDAVVTGKGTVDLYNPKVVRAAMGALWEISHVEADDLPDMLRALREDGFVLFGADLQGTPVERWEPAPRSVLVLGSEAHGLSREVVDVVTERILIPGRRRPGAESLNVAVAAGILMYEWTRISGRT